MFARVGGWALPLGPPQLSGRCLVFSVPDQYINRHMFQQPVMAYLQPYIKPFTRDYRLTFVIHRPAWASLSSLITYCGTRQTAHCCYLPQAIVFSLLPSSRSLSSFYSLCSNHNNSTAFSSQLVTHRCIVVCTSCRILDV